MPAGGYRLGWEGDWIDQPPTIYAYAGQSETYSFNFLDGSGDHVDLTGYTLSAFVMNAATGFPTLFSGTTTVVNAAHGLFTWKNVAWGLPGVYRLTVQAVSGGNTLIAGPVMIEVRSR